MIDNEPQERIQCTRCKMNLTLDKFKKKRDDTYQKRCIECNIKTTTSQQKYKCEHGKRRSQCKECGGSSICEHEKQRSRCKACDPQGHLSNLIRSTIYNALKQEKKECSIKYLGCTVDEFKQHIESQLKEGMNWENYGEWHIDHIIPLKYDKPSIEEVIGRLHYKNTQPLWASDNISKGNRFIG